MSDGDNISLVDDSKIPEKERHKVKKLNVTYELCRSEGEDMAKFDDVKKFELLGEILVQTMTEPIVIDSDSEAEESVAVEKEKMEKEKKKEKPSQKNGSVKKVVDDDFTDDFEIGEPSRIPRPPTPPKTDPVSRVRQFSKYFQAYLPKTLIFILLHKSDSFKKQKKYFVLFQQISRLLLTHSFFEKIINSNLKAEYGVFESRT